MIMGEPRAITYKEVQKAGGNADTWRQICEITGAGHVPVNDDGNAAIDITGLSPSKIERIEKLLAAGESDKGESEKATGDAAASGKSKREANK